MLLWSRPHTGQVPGGGDSVIHRNAGCVANSLHHVRREALALDAIVEPTEDASSIRHAFGHQQAGLTKVDLSNPGTELGARAQKQDRVLALLVFAHEAEMLAAQRLLHAPAQRCMLERLRAQEQSVAVAGRERRDAAELRLVQDSILADSRRRAPLRN